MKLAIIQSQLEQAQALFQEIAAQTELEIQFLALLHQRVAVALAMVTQKKMVEVVVYFRGQEILPQLVPHKEILEDFRSNLAEAALVVAEMATAEVAAGVMVAALSVVEALVEVAMVGAA